jgi:hypothetical protein
MLTSATTWKHKQINTPPTTHPNHNTGGCECSTKWKAPDDGHKGARNM